MDIIFEDIYDALKSITDFRWVDEDQGQLDIYKDPPVEWPCALLSIDVPEWTAIKEKSVQPGRAQVTVKLGFNVLHEIGNAPESQIQSAMSHFATVKKVTKALRGKCGTTYKHLERTSTIKTINEIGVKIYTITFSCSMVEVIPPDEE